jgi:hypothetical protein
MSNGQRGVETALPPRMRRGNLSARVATILKRYIVAEHLDPDHRLPADDDRQEKRPGVSVRG